MYIKWGSNKIRLLFGFGITLFLGLIIFSGSSEAAVINSDGAGGGDWDVGASWNGGVSPGTGDDGVILSGDTITLTGAQTTGSIEVQSGGEFADGGYTLIVDDENGGGYVFNNGGTISCSGTVEITTPTTTKLRESSSGTIYNLIINSGNNVLWDITTTISNDLTITSGSFYHNGVGYGLTVANDVMVNGVLGAIGWSGSASFGSLTVNSGGSATLSSGTTTITSETAGGSAIDDQGGAGLTHGSGTVIITTPTATKIFTNNPFYDFVVNHASAEVELRASTTISSDLTITLGKLYSRIGTPNALIVTGDVSISGILGDSTDEFSLVTVNSLTIESGGTYEATSGETVITGVSGGYSFDAQSGSDYAHNDGLTNFTNSASTSAFRTLGGENLYDVSIYTPNRLIEWGPNQIIEGNLYVNQTDMLKAGNNAFSLEVQGNCIINAILGQGDETGDWSFGSILTNSGGVLEATSGTLTVSGDWDNSGTFTNNGGELEISGAGGVALFVSGGGVYYDLTFNNDGHITVSESFTIENDWSISFDGGALAYGCTLHEPTGTVTIGTVSSAGSITGTDGIRMSRSWNIYGASASYPFTVTNSDSTFFYDDGGNVNLKWAVWQTDLVTEGVSLTVTLDGDSDFAGLEVFAGDTLDLNGFKLTSSSTVTISSGATLVPDGEIEATTFTDNNALTITSGQTFILENTTTATVNAITIGATATLSAPVLLQGLGNFINYGTFIHSDGLVYFSGSNGAINKVIGASEITFYDVKVGKLVTHGDRYNPITIINSLIIENSEFYVFRSQPSGGNPVTLILGDGTQSGTITNNGGIRINNAGASVTIQGADEDYPGIIIGNQPDYDYDSTGDLYLKWVGHQMDVTTGTGVDITLSGDCTFAGLTLSSGDTLDMNGFRLTSSSTVTITDDWLDPDGEIEAVSLVLSDLWVQSGDSLTLTNTTTATVNAVTVNGTLEAPGTMHQSGTLDIDGVFTHNNNLVNFSGIDLYPGGSSFYDLYIRTNNTNLWENVTIENLMLIDMSGPDPVYRDFSDLRIRGSIVITLGTISSIGNISCLSDYDYLDIYDAGSTVLIQGASEDYLGEIYGDWSGILHGMDATSLLQIKWTNFTNGLRMESYKLRIEMVGNSTFTGSPLSMNEFWVEQYFNMNGYTLTVDELNIDDHFYGPGDIVGINPGFVTLDADITLNSITLGKYGWLLIHQGGVEVKVDRITDLGESFIEIRAATLNFTSTQGFQLNDTGLYLFGTVTSYATLTGVPNWYINETEIGFGIPGEEEYTRYIWRYANVSNGKNYGDDYILVLGNNVTGNTGKWDFVAPVIVSLAISEGEIIDLALNDWILNITHQISDMSYLHSLEYEIYCTDNDTLMASGSLDMGAEGLEVRQYTWSEFVDVGGSGSAAWVGNFNITFRAWDTHNSHKSQTFEGKKRARDMIIEVGGELIGHKVKKKGIELEDNIVTISSSSGILEELLKIEFIGKDRKKVKSTITYTSEDNFKLLHEVKLDDQATFTLKLTGENLRIEKNSSYYYHVTYGPGNKYFWDAQDFKEEGGTIFLVEQGETAEGIPWIKLLFIHPDFKKNSWNIVDPLAGSVNEGSLIVNFSTISSVQLIMPENGSTIDKVGSAEIIVLVSGIGAYTGNVSFIDAETGSLIQRVEGVSDGDRVSITWIGLSWNTEFSFYTWLNLSNGLNVTSPTWSFTTAREPYGGGLQGAPDPRGEKWAESAGIWIGAGILLMVVVVAILIIIRYYYEDLMEV